MLQTFCERFPRSTLFWRLFIAHFIVNLSIAMFFLFPLRIEDMGGSRAQIGLIMGLALIAGIIIRPLSGTMMDRFGRRIWFLLGGILTVVPCFLYMLIDEIGPMIYLLRIVHGMGVGVLFGTFFTVAADLAPASHEIDHIGIFGISGLLPMAFGPKVGEMVLAAASFDLFFFIAGLLALLSLTLTLTMPETIDRQDREIPTPFSFRFALSPSLLPVWLHCALFGAAITACFTFLAPYTRSVGFHGISGFFMVYVATSTICRLFFGSLPERFGVIRFTGFAFLCLIIGFGLIGATRSEVFFLFGGFWIGLGHAYLFPILVTLATQRSPRQNRGSAVTISTAMMDAGGLAFSPLLGVIGDHFGYPVLFWAVAFLVIIPVAVIALRERERYSHFEAQKLSCKPQQA